MDYPATRFVPPAGDDISLMIFPLECGWGSEGVPEPQSEQLLRKVIVERLATQHELYEKRDKPEQPLTECIPSRGALGSVRINCSLSEQGRYEFFVHIPLPRPVPKAQLPECVIGFHEHEEGYSYAVITADGTLVEAGDLAIPSHALPTEGRTYPRSYIYEVRKAMVALALKHNACIGVEDTVTTNRQPSLSRAQNQRRYSRPSRTIIMELRPAALLAGLLVPLTIRSIPSRCCGDCGKKVEAGTKIIVERET